MPGGESPNSIVHRLINQERRKRGLPWAKWNQGLYYTAKSQADEMAKRGRLFHSDMATLTSLQAAENCWMGKGIGDRALPKSILGSWMKSTAGHRENLLNPEIGSQGIAISKSRHGVFAVWQGSLERDFEKIELPEVHLPDLSKAFSRLRGFFKPKPHSKKGGQGMLRLPVNLLLKCLSVLGIILGAHGFYVYLHRLDFPIGAEKLFLALSVPARLQGLVSWMTAEGIHGWFIPIVFVVAGMVLWSFSNRIGGQFTLLRKLHLW